MASLAHDGNGRYRVILTLPDRRRLAIRLGKCTSIQAETARANIEVLPSGGWDDPQVSRWLAGIYDTLHGRLSKHGLCPPRVRTLPALQDLLADFFAALNVKPATATAYGHTRRNLLDFFGANKLLRDIGPADAEKFRQHLQGQHLSPATVARRVILARQVFKQAVRWRLVGENPFDGVRGGKQTNKARMQFVSREDIDKVLAVVPDAQWRLLIVSSRYAGLRCPSEHLALKWGDVDWEQDRIRVPSCKTEHHEGKDCRFIPLFPELRGPLMEVFEQAPPGTEQVITRWRDTAVNLRTHFLRLIRRAGLKPWPKLWHNLRSSRQTELAEEYPAHVVCAWMGNFVSVAQDHYLQVRDEYFIAAAQGETAAARSTAESSEPQRKPEGENRVFAVLSGTENADVEYRMGAPGFEPGKA